MKKIIVIIALILIIGIIVGIVAYNLNSQNQEENVVNTAEEQSTTSKINANVLPDSTEDNNNVNATYETENTASKGDEEMVANTRIKLTVNGNEEVFANIEDNVASRDFLDMLPLTLTFEDFNNTEKIANIPSELNIEGLPSGYTPESGDLAYYAPWGNISVFYKDFRYSDSLYKLGTLESGADIFENMNEDFEVTIERVN